MGIVRGMCIGGPTATSFRVPAHRLISQQELGNFLVVHKARRDCTHLAQSLQRDFSEIESRKADAIAQHLVLAMDSNGDERASLDELEGYISKRQEKSQFRSSIQGTEGLSESEIQRIMQEKRLKEERKSQYRAHKRQRALSDSRSASASSAVSSEEAFPHSCTESGLSGTVPQTNCHDEL